MYYIQDHIAVPPPPPPPLPQPQVVSYLTKSSPIKRQGTYRSYFHSFFTLCYNTYNGSSFFLIYFIVIGSPPKVQHRNIVSDIKRIRVCPPKPGSLYPNLSDIEPSTESESNSEYTVDSSEAVTATLDEKSETGTSDYVQVR